MNTVPQPSEREPHKRPVPDSLRALLENLIDYAGLFPPAALDMQTAVCNYAHYLTSEHSWMLARFVLPASSLADFGSAQASLPTPDDRAGPDRSASVTPAVARASSPAPRSAPNEQRGAAPFPAGEGAKRRGSSEWKLSALLGPNPAHDIEQIADFNLHNTGRARVDSVECKVTTATEIQRLSALLPADITGFFEIAPDHAPELLPIIRQAGARAKIRTGGTTPEAIPSSETVASFIAACARSGVAFKATAGLHHPLRCVKPLTYENDAPQATMHGFLNVFLVAAQCYHYTSIHDRQWLDPESTRLAATSPTLEFNNDFARMRIDFPPVERPTTAGWTGSSVAPCGFSEMRIPTAHIRRTRREFAISFGSCSFEEPISDLQELNLL